MRQGAAAERAGTIPPQGQIQNLLTLLLNTAYTCKRLLVERCLFRVWAGGDTSRQHLERTEVSRRIPDVYDTTDGRNEGRGSNTGDERTHITSLYTWSLSPR